jgi:hypothetical protein
VEDEIWLTACRTTVLTGVSTVTVYSLVRRGHLEVEGLDHRGQKLFRHLAVAQAEKATGAKAKRVLVLPPEPGALSYFGRTMPSSVT